MNFIKTLSRNEMRSTMGGDPSCYGACTDFSGSCIEACLEAFEPHEDLRPYCLDTCHIQVEGCMSSCVEA